MIIHRLEAKSGLAIVTPEDVDDLWTLRRIVSGGDLVSGQTSRVVKQKGDYVRPDKGERVKVHVTVEVEKIRLDSTLERLRINGKIVEVSNDLLSKGSYHSLIVSPGYKLSLKKVGFNENDLRIIRASISVDQGFAVLALDGREACIGIVRGTHLHIYPTIESGASGKYYTQTKHFLTPYFSKIQELLLSIYENGLKIFVMGPGAIKNGFVNYLLQNKRKMEANVRILEGFDVAGEDGVYTSLKSEALRKALEKSKLATVIDVMNEALKRISRDDERIALSFKDSLNAAKIGAVETSLISDRIFEYGVKEDELIEYLNTVESKRGRTFLLDHSTDIGNQVSSLGGVVSLLRFHIRMG